MKLNGNKKQYKSYSELSKDEKKKLMDVAAAGANKLQKELVKKYDSVFPNGPKTFVKTS